MIQRATQPQSLLLARVDLDAGLFNQLIETKGRNASYEMAVRCPCSSKEVGSLPSCRNCGGMSWLFINKKSIKAIAQHVNLVNEYKNWSEEARGTVSVTVSHGVGLSFMDRISLTDAESIYSEVVHMMNFDSDVFTFLVYPVKKIICVGLFTATSDPITWLEPNEYVIDGQILRPTNGSVIEEGMSLTVRYVHAPTYHIVEIQRESTESFKKIEIQEVIQRFPVSAIAKRSHYMLDQKSAGSVQLHNNSYSETSGCL